MPDGPSGRDSTTNPEAVECLFELGASRPSRAATPTLAELIALAPTTPIGTTRRRSKRTRCCSRRDSTRSAPSPSRTSRRSGSLRDTGEPFWVATALLEQAEWLAARGRDEEARPLLDEARDIWETLGATAPSDPPRRNVPGGRARSGAFLKTGCGSPSSPTRLARALLERSRVALDALRVVWHRKRPRSEVLLRVRRRARPRLPRVLGSHRRGGEVLLGLRDVARDAAVVGARAPRGACIGATPGLGAVRRPGRVHGAVRGTRLRGRARAPDALLRHRPDR